MHPVLIVDGKRRMPKTAAQREADVDLHLLYRQLRQALEAAYAARPWNGACIDRIADHLLHLEFTLAAHRLQPPAGDAQGGPWSRSA
jgi:hypothetical protein